MNKVIQGIDSRSDVSAQGLTTICVGGAIERLYGAHSDRALRELLAREESAGEGLRCLGAGSNSLFPDEVFRAPIVQLVGDFRGIHRVSDQEFLVGAGVSLMRLARHISSKGLSGLEFAGGIPASVGGAVWMNAGAHGGDIGSRVVSIDCMTPTGEVVTLRQGEISFRYRSSNLPDRWIVLRALLKFVPSDRDQTARLLAENLAYRKRTQPLTIPSFGSTFRNPDKIMGGDLLTAGELIEQAGLKGTRVGGAEISTLHANWVVNPGRKATAKDIQALLELVQETVATKKSVSLHPEVVDWSAFSRRIPPMA